MHQLQAIPPPDSRYLAEQLAWLNPMMNSRQPKQVYVHHIQGSALAHPRHDA
jgi:hypothetical protein